MPPEVSHALLPRAPGAFAPAETAVTGPGALDGDDVPSDADAPSDDRAPADPPVPVGVPDVGEGT